MHLLEFTQMQCKTDAFLKETKPRLSKTKLSKICLNSFSTISIDALIFYGMKTRSHLL